MKKLKLAYLAGLIAADGHLRKKDFTVIIYIKDNKFSEKIKSLLKEFIKNKISQKIRKNVIELSFTQKDFAKKITTKYKIPVGKKAEKIIFPEWISKSEKIAFIEGFFDGDDLIYKRKVKVSSNNIKEYYEIKFKSKSKKFLKSCKKFLETLGIKTSEIRTYNKQIPYFVISKRDCIIRFFDIFHPILKTRPSTLRGEIL